MGKKTVKKRVFMSNAMMLLVISIVFLIIRIIITEIGYQIARQQVEVYTPQSWQEPMEHFGIINSYSILFLVDGVLNIGGLAVVSHLFAGRLVKHIEKPLNALKEGAKRIQNDDLSAPVEYAGDTEFEDLCATFNAMQGHILKEREKNRKYEKARADMIAGISHDLRTPLTAVKGSLKGMLDKVATTPDQQKRFLEMAYRRTGDIDRLLNQLLYVSRMETENVLVTLEGLELADFIKEYVNVKRELLEQRAATLTAKIGVTCAYVQAHPGYLWRIFDNLLENAQKYGRKSPLEICITLNEGKGFFHISFSDNGVGVSDEQILHLFEEFYRGDESRNQNEGSGLGLYIVRHLTEAMKGRAWAESHGGLTVHIELPTV